jgi:hypothetical protein
MNHGSPNLLDVEFDVAGEDMMSRRGGYDESAAKELREDVDKAQKQRKCGVERRSVFLARGGDLQKKIHFMKGEAVTFILQETHDLLTLKQRHPCRFGHATSPHAA